MAPDGPQGQAKDGSKPKAASSRGMGLGPKAARLWREITGEYELRADELRVLEEACREIDVIEALQKALSQPGVTLTVPGSMGQLVAHPLLQELRQHRAILQRLLAGLKLPDDPGGIGDGTANTSSEARKAAERRWSRGA